MRNNSEREAMLPDVTTRLAAERTRLAYGRTLLGWIRTAVSLITFGFSIFQFFRLTRREVVESEYLIGPREFGMSMIVIGLIALLIATWEHRRAMRALRTQFPDIRDLPETVLAFLVAVLGLMGILVTSFRY